MRILFLSGSADLGGAERALLDLVTGIAAAEPDLELLLVVPGAGALQRGAASAGLAVEILPYPAALAHAGERAAASAAEPAASAADVASAARRMAARAANLLAPLPALLLAAPSAVSYVRSLRALVRDHQPDLIHSNALRMHVLASLAKGPAPLVWHLHDYIGPHPLTSRLLRLLAPRCAGVVANSRDVADDARRVLGTRVPVHHVHNGIDLARFAPTGPASDLDARAGLPAAPAGTLRVGLIATFAQWKGHDVFLHALAQLDHDRDGPEIRGYVIGGAVHGTTVGQATTEELRDAADQLGLTGRVGFTGHTEHPERAMRALDIVVHASTRPEPFGLVIAEAMACGRPVIVSAAGGAAELVQDGRNALTFTHGDPASLADRIRHLADDPALRARLGRAAREHAMERFDRGRFAREMRRIHRRLVPLGRMSRRRRIWKP